MCSDNSDDSEDILCTHISDDETASKRTRREKILRAANPKKQAKFQHGFQTEATDAQGRVHFHGAFTFSAGYYNTVGSDDGWAPSEWHSKHNMDGFTGVRLKPEDFMDHEDLAELKSEGALLVTRAGFAKRPQLRAASLTAGAATATEADGADPAVGKGSRSAEEGGAAALASLLSVRPRPPPRRAGCPRTRRATFS